MSENGDAAVSAPTQNADDQILPRRKFLRWATGLSALASGALIGTPTLRALLSPAFERRSALKWTKVGEAATFELGVPVKIEFTETLTDAWVSTRALRSVWVYTVDGENFVAYNPKCTHLGCGYDYSAAEKMFHCPCHEGKFDVKTGARIAGPPPRPLDKLQLKVTDGFLYVAYQDFRLGVANSEPV